MTDTTTEMLALAPCPFCGGEAERVDIDPMQEEFANAGGSVIQCKSCGASSPVHFDRKENLDASWNTRHLASQPSSYEAGPCAWLRDVGVVASDGQHDECLIPAAKNDPGAFPVYRGALPADGGEESGGRAVIEGDAVVIRFPLDAMQTAMDGAWSLRAFDTRYKITDINEFAKEFRNALNREDEQGTTEIHKMADRAFIDCIESGAFGIEEHEQQDI